MDQEAIKNAEARIADVQAALDDAQRVLQTAQRAQDTARDAVHVMRRVALAAVGGLIVIAVLAAFRRARGPGSRTPQT